MFAVFCVLAVPAGRALADEPGVVRNDTTAATWAFSSLSTNRGEALGHALVGADKNGRGVGFRCFNKNLLAAIALEPRNVLAALASSGRQRAVRVYVSIGDAEPELQDWVLMVHERVIVTADHKVTPALYNAAVRGEPVRIDPRRHGDGVYIYEMPAPEPTAFADFMSACEFSAR